MPHDPSPQIPSVDSPPPNVPHINPDPLIFPTMPPMDNPHPLFPTLPPNLDAPIPVMPELPPIPSTLPPILPTLPPIPPVLPTLPPLPRFQLGMRFLLIGSSDTDAFYQSAKLTLDSVGAPYDSVFTWNPVPQLSTATGGNTPPPSQSTFSSDHFLLLTLCNREVQWYRGCYSLSYLQPLGTFSSPLPSPLTHFPILSRSSHAYPQYVDGCPRCLSRTIPRQESSAIRLSFSRNANYRTKGHERHVFPH